MFTAGPLTPLWVENTGISALDKMTARPVLIGVETLGKLMHGQVLELTASQARVLPDDPFLLWKSVLIKIRFRWADVEYNLSGMTIESHEDNSFTFEFDCVTRKYLAVLGKQLEDAGLMNSGAARSKPVSKLSEELDHGDPPIKHEINTRAASLLVRHEKPPGGKERRVHHRYDLDAEAKLAIVNSDRILDCIVLELSLGGCRVYSETPISLDLGAWVEVQFIECGLPLRLAAKIQVKSGEKIAGLMFHSMSIRMQERLNNLIWEIAEKERASQSPILSPC
jgi:hypothetical protein